MNQLVTPDWVTKAVVQTLVNQVNLLSVLRRVYDDEPDKHMPSFEHIPTEVGREASRRLWRAAGSPKAT